MSDETEKDDVMDGPAYPVYWHDIQPSTGIQVVRMEQPGLTLRQHAAIELRVPRSGVPELDAMIRESLVDEWAGKALTAVINDSWRTQPELVTDDYDVLGRGIAQDAWRLARAMLAEKLRRGEVDETD